MKIDPVLMKRLLSPHTYKNLDSFVEELPLRAGHGAIMAGAASWVLACLAITYVVMQANNIMTLRADILKAEALKPTVPVINKVAVEEPEIQAFVKRVSELYPQINIIAAGNRVELRATDTQKYGAFREVIGHFFNGGKGWRVAIDTMCVGRECKNNTGLFAGFTIHRLRVDKPTG